MELARNLKVESVLRLNPVAPLCLRPEQTVRDAVQVMRQHRSGCVLVRDQGRLVGVFTERDLLTRILARDRSLETQLRTCMTRDPLTVQRADPIYRAVQLMQEGDYRHLPVTDESGEPEGVLSVKRIIHYLVEHFPTTIYCLPPDPNRFPLTREGA